MQTVKVSSGSSNTVYISGLLGLSACSLLFICTRRFFQFSSLKYRVWWTWFLVYFELEFYSRQKNPVQIRKKIQFILDISNWGIAKIKGVVYFVDPVYGPFRQSKMDRTLNFCPRLARRKQMFHYIRKTKSLRS